MKKLLLLPGLFIALASTAQIRDTIKLSNLHQCATVTLQRPNTFFGERGVIAETEPKYNYLIRTYFKLDLSSIPAGSVIHWAKLSLYNDPLFSSQTTHNTSLLRRVTSPWDPSTVTWNTQPATTKRGQVVLPMSPGLYVYENYKDVNVWTLIQAMVDSPSASFGFELLLDSENVSFARMSFVSPKFNNPERDPRLIVEYTAPGLRPAVSSMAFGNGSSTEMTIYPNPCNKTFNCDIKSADPENMILRVLDVLGRTVYSEPVNASNLQVRVNLPTNSAGTYFVVLQDSKNETVVSQELQVN